jgi:hypothetical protein
MPHLWEVEHPYYCNEGNYYAAGNDQPFITYESWAEFFENEGNSDTDMNLLFRWDWRKADPEEKHWGNEHEVLMLFWMGQRKGLYRWTEVRVTEADEPAVRAWLKERWEHLKFLWEPLSEPETETV